MTEGGKDSIRKEGEKAEGESKRKREEGGCRAAFVHFCKAQIVSYSGKVETQHSPLRSGYQVKEGERRKTEMGAREGHRGAERGRERWEEVRKKNEIG